MRNRSTTTTDLLANYVIQLTSINAQINSLQLYEPNFMTSKVYPAVSTSSEGESTLSDAKSNLVCSGVTSAAEGFRDTICSALLYFLFFSPSSIQACSYSFRTSFDLVSFASLVAGIVSILYIFVSFPLIKRFGTVRPFFPPFSSSYFVTFFSDDQITASLIVW